MFTRPLPRTRGRQLKSQEQEIRDIQREFAVERDDYLETIRRQEQGMRLLEQLLTRVQPTIRKDCNYADLEAIKKQAIWDEVEQKWRLPELQLQKTKLPPPGTYTRRETRGRAVCS